MADVQEYVAGKSVALVGNASSIIGKGHGESIDSHDVVVRVNNGVPGTEENMGRTESLGSRMDVWSGTKPPDQYCWFYPPNRGSAFKRARIDLGPWNSRVTQVWCVPWAWSELVPSLVAKAYVAIAEWQDLNRKLKIRVSSGCAIAVLLSRCRPGEVRLFGFDFFLSPSLQTGAQPPPHEVAGKRQRERAWIVENTNFEIVP